MDGKISHLSKRKKVVLTQLIGDSEEKMIICSGIKPNVALIEGRFVSSRFGGNGFYVHGGESDELINSTCISTAPSSLIVTLLLQGKINFAYDELDFNFDASLQPLGVAVNLTKPVNFRRDITKNNHVKKLHLVLSPSWLEGRLGDNGRLSEFMLVHKNHKLLHISALILTTTNKILALKSPSSFLESIRLEALSYALLAEITEQLVINQKVTLAGTECLTADDVTTKDATNLDKSSGKIENILSYIECHLDQSLLLEQIATQFSMSISNLQRTFKQQLGVDSKQIYPFTSFRDC